MDQIHPIQVHRTLKLILTATVATLFLGCNSKAPISKPFVIKGDTLGWSDSLYVHFQEGFYSDSLTVLVNDEIYGVFIDLTTSEAWSFADGSGIPLQSTKSVTVFLHRAARMDSLSLEIQTNNFIGLSYNSRDRWIVQNSRKPFIYE